MPLLGTRGAASARGFGFGGVFVAPPGQQAYTTAGTYTWVCPAGVTSVSVVAVGGASNFGGGLGYKNNISVTPGNSYTVVVGAKGTVTGINVSAGGDSYFISTSTVKGGGAPASGGSTGGNFVGDGGGNGGGGGAGLAGGAGGYAGNGGNGGSPGPSRTSGTAGSGGAGGGGGGGQGTNPSGIFQYGGGGGGGVGLLGQSSNGAGGGTTSTVGLGGGGGSGGAAGTNGSGSTGGGGGNYGGGAGTYGAYWACGCVFDGSFGTPSGGAVRIIWPGNARQFPSTRTGNE